MITNILGSIIGILFVVGVLALIGVAAASVLGALSAVVPFGSFGLFVVAWLFYLSCK